MGARLRSWWHLKTVLVVLIILVVVIVLIIIGYRFNWTGFNGNNKSGKTLWDWLQLLIIPSVLTFGVWWLTRLQHQRDQQFTDQRAQTERDIALDNQQEAALQTYLDKMSEL